MIRYTRENQLPLPGFETPLESTLDHNSRTAMTLCDLPHILLHNRWVKLTQIIPWDELADAYYSRFHHRHGRPVKRCAFSHWRCHHQAQALLE